MQETIQVCNKLSSTHPAFNELLFLWILTKTNSWYRFKLILTHKLFSEFLTTTKTCLSLGKNKENIY